MKKQAELPSQFAFPYVILNEYKSQAGVAKGHYFHQDLFVANQVFLSRPDVHLDIGSRVETFVAHLLTFEQKVIIGDIRPLEIKKQNIQYIRVNLMDPQMTDVSGYQFDSISCLHVIEHMGLGRYGDPLDINGHLKAIHTLSLLLKPNGKLYISFPISFYGRIEFNAHRVFSIEQSEKMFNSAALIPISFSYIDDKGDFHGPQCPMVAQTQVESAKLNYGCGIWTLTKYH